MDKVINDANAEIDNLNQRLSRMTWSQASGLSGDMLTAILLIEMHMDHDKLKADNIALLNVLREKTRKQQQTQELYDRLKRKQMAMATQSAAFESVDEVLQNASRAQPASWNQHEQSEYVTRGPNLLETLGGLDRTVSNASNGNQRALHPLFSRSGPTFTDQALVRRKH
jgi:E3 ubiquitin-protein ligase CCNP1IP1